MKSNALSKLAHTNLENLINNRCPGPGIVVGLDRFGKNIIHVSFIIGRSRDSANWRYVSNGSGDIRTKCIEGEAKSQELATYAMKELNGRYAVSNGQQTNDAVGSTVGLMNENFFNTWSYEEDRHSTPRITAVTLLHQAKTDMLIVRKKFSGGVEYGMFPYEDKDFIPGYGFIVHTYKGHGEPLLPSFEGRPYEIPLKGRNPEEVANKLWNVLNPDHRIAIGVKFINLRSGVSSMNIINKYEKVTA
jgi:hypothetical protein